MKKEKFIQVATLLQSERYEEAIKIFLEEEIDEALIELVLSNILLTEIKVKELKLIIPKLREVQKLIQEEKMHISIRANFRLNLFLEMYQSTKNKDENAKVLDEYIEHAAVRVLNS